MQRLTRCAPGLHWREHVFGTILLWSQPASQGQATLGGVLTKFVDPSGPATCFPVPQGSETVEDELLVQE